MPWGWDRTSRKYIISEMVYNLREEIPRKLNWYTIYEKKYYLQIESSQSLDVDVLLDWVWYWTKRHVLKRISGT